MNGWFMHDLKKFPPSKHISPFFISFHCAREELIQKNIEYFKKFEPIGCRDTITVEKLKRYGIDAYFSGCLTLYFDKSTQKRNIDCVISDINKCSYIPKVNFDYSDFKNALLTSHDIENRYYRKDLYWRLFKAQQLLNIYRDAKNVITNRLHVALPSIAMGTPVKFIHANMQDERFSGYKNILLPEKSSDANDTKFSSMELSVNEIKLKFDLIELQNTNKK